MKIVFAGTPAFALAPLKAIVDAGYEVVGVVTQADKPQGRKGILTPPPVKTLAESLGLPVLQPVKIKDSLEELKALGGDLLVTCAYGQILTQAVLDVFPLGVWNIHAGLLPFYRGASPIQSCILNGETETGVSVMRTELGLDTGDILLVERTEIIDSETYGELSDRLSVLGGKAIVDALRLLQSGEYTLVKQGEDGARTVRKITKEQAKIDFTRTMQEIVNLVRGMNPAPVAYTQTETGVLNIYRAEPAPEFALEEGVCGEIVCDIPKKGLVVKCGDGAVRLTEVQPTGGKRMKGSDFLNGRKVQKGQVFLC